MSKNVPLTSGQLQIDLSALQDNYRILDGISHFNCDTGAAIKADGYGLGVSEVSRALFDAGCSHFFVATIDEGIILRELFRQDAIEAKISILGGLLPGCAEIFAEYQLTPVLNSTLDIEEWNAFNASKNQVLPSILHIDTGMSRLGLDRHDLHKIEEGLVDVERTGIEIVMSHFACADDLDHPMTDQQYQQFLQTSSLFPNARKSLANSSAIMRSSDYHFDLTRPGMAIYGLNPTPEAKNPMNRVVSLSVPVLQMRSGRKGESAGYGASHVFERDVILATVSLGYADGYMRSLSNQGTLYWKDYACAVLGRVSMDTVILDLTDIPEHDLPKRGDLMEVIGSHQSADDVAQKAGTIGYEILTSLGARYKRHYIKL